MERYQAFVFGVHVFTFDLAGPIAPLVFNVLDIAAVLVIVGVSLAMWRRGRDRGALAVQQFGDDLLPLVMLFAVSITGVFLTAVDPRDAGAPLRLPLATPRGHGDLHAALSAVREVLPHLPAAGAARRRLLPQNAARRATRLGACAAAARSRRRCTSTISNRWSASSGSATRRSRCRRGYGRALSGRLPAVPPQDARADAGRLVEAWRRNGATARLDSRSRRAVRAAPQARARRRLDHARRARSRW